MSGYAEGLLVVLCALLAPVLSKSSARLRRHFEELHYVASHDDVTGLQNRFGFQQELDRQMNVPLATTAVALDSRNATVRGRVAAIGNLIADAMRERTRADLAIMNGGGIRGGKVYEAGTAITRRDVQAELPFGNHLVTLNVKGSELRLA